ncbi:WD repeat-containing protein 43-like [Gigantopelta aegis]|uniref:WD repeat-containing protein 43-like n=1 Tax=Gigantopelta aegis TaxID=1735272 RepID=UPI001B8880C0|nr:WD repeat-containing protein 43-like [Gigantopelta aegis]
MAVACPVAFSTNGEFLAYSGPDGVLKIWDASTGQVKQEYTPSSHLSATCSCLSWGPGRHFSSASSRKKKKRKSGGASEIGELDLIAVGTTNGSILLYSVVKGELQTQLVDHTDTVNGICWYPDGEILYSCSSDHHVAEWDVMSNKVKQKWKVDRGPVYSVCLCSKTLLLTASRSIKLWNRHNRQLLQTFTGHSTEISRLLSIPQSSDGHTLSDAADGHYFLSTALNDRLVNAWFVNKDYNEKNAVATFSLPDESVHLSLNTSSHDQSLLLTAVCKNGQVLIFEHLLNGKLKAPLQPKVSIQIACSSGKDDTPRPIPVLAVHVGEDRERWILLAHGTFLKPTFEKVVYDTSQPSVCLIRDDPTQTTLKKDSSLAKIRTPDVSKEATVLMPGHMVPREPATRPRKRRISTGELTMEQRLDAISIEKTSAKAPPVANNFALLLTQGLTSNDSKILNHVLQKTGDRLLKNTIKKLPITMIIPLMQELSRRMQGSPQSGSNTVKWIKTVLAIHTSYLITCPDIIEKLSGLYQMMDSRVSTFSKLSRLQGKLDLMLAQISTNDAEEEDASGKTEQPLLMYQDESSDEEFPIETILPSESEDNWEDVSNMDEEEKEETVENGQELESEEESSEEEDDDEMEAD